MNETVYVPDVLWHQWRRAYPVGDLGACLRAAMRNDIAEHNEKQTTLRELRDRAVRLVGNRNR